MTLVRNRAALPTQWPPRLQVAVGLLLLLASLLGAAVMEAFGSSYQPVHLAPDDWLEMASRIRVVLAGSLAACVLAAGAFVCAAVRDGDVSARAPAVVGVLVATGFASIDLRVGLDLLHWITVTMTHAP